jgi:hypothetical protein
LPHIQEALCHATARRVEAQAPPVLNVLVEVMNDLTALEPEKGCPREPTVSTDFLGRESASLPP